MIPPETQKEMAERMNPKKTIRLEASHASLASHPKEVTALILEAAAIPKNISKNRRCLYWRFFYLKKEPYFAISLFLRLYILFSLFSFLFSLF
jgi:hypothetical protein